MSSYMGIGQWAATFSGDVPEGQVAKISGSGAVSACAARRGVLRRGDLRRKGRCRMLRGAGRNADGSLQRRGSRSGLDDTDR